MTKSETRMFLFTLADGMTAAGVGTSQEAALAWLRGVAIAPYDTMEIVRCEDYRGMTAERKAEIAEIHAPRIYEAPCPQCGIRHKCEPWATELCIACRRQKPPGGRTPIERWKAEQEERHGHYAVLAGFEKAMAAHDEELKEAYDAWDVDIQLKLFDFLVSQIKATVVATRMAILQGMDDTGP